MTSPLNRRDFLSASLFTAGVGVTALRAPTLWGAPAGALSSSGISLIQPVDFSRVTIEDLFWQPKQRKVATVTLRACIEQTEQKTGRIRNFEKAARREGEHEGIYFDDSDVYKALEAIAYSLKTHPNPELERKADEWIEKIAAAQLPDGYLNTYYTLTGLDKRWTDMEKHEEYCAGHLIEAAVAYYRTTGKRKLLDVAIRFADHLDQTFRIPNRHWVSGHQGIELALVKLYHLTGTERYLKLAEWYLDQRGRGYGRGHPNIWGENGDLEYCQDAVPVKEQREIVGHAVRAMYLYSGAADVAAATGDAGYMRAMKTVWEDVVYRNMYVTGGIGSAGKNEGFSVDYDLPNLQAYCETCASVGMVFWNQRMNLLTGESQYIDVLERSLYNGALDGLSLSGDRFFYGNPLASTAAYVYGHGVGRKEWFGVACCPSNIARLVASLGSYVYSASKRDIYVNLYIASSTKVRMGAADVGLQVATNYPWEGNVRITVTPEQRARYGVRLRIPGWTRGVAVPGDLYRFTNTAASNVEVLLNGKPVKYREEKGYAVIERVWNRGDVIELRLPMPVRQVVAREEVAANRHRVALQRGPLVYCVEGIDNGGTVWDFIVPADASFKSESYRVLDESVMALRAEARAFRPSADGLAVQAKAHTITAIPYYSWANRDNYEMQVWLPTRLNDIKINS